MFSTIYLYIANNFPSLGKPKRYFLAYLAKYLKIQDSYAQIGDDKIAIDLLKEKVLNRPIFYIDVGANHPSRLSNTYRMYREGAAGVTIDPNDELMRLHQLIRPRDIQLSIGCGRNIELLKFYYSTTPVLSSFSESQVENLWRASYLPVFTLDKICADLKITAVDFLSIDVEGLDIEVLEGANEILLRTYLICIEASSEEGEMKIIKYMNLKNFELKIKNKWNLFFIRRQCIDNNVSLVKQSKERQ